MKYKTINLEPYCSYKFIIDEEDKDKCELENISVNLDSWITTQNLAIGILYPFFGQKRLVEAVWIKFKDSWRNF